MLNRYLPYTVNLKKLTDKGAHLEGEVPVDRLERLLDIVECASGGVQVHLKFGKDEIGKRIAEGQARCVVSLVCQRCLEQYEQELDVKLSLGFVQSEAQIEQLPEKYEPVMIEEEDARLVDLIEDDLILALPIVAYHPKKDCYLFERSEEPLKTQEKESPFKVLASLKANKDRA